MGIMSIMDKHCYYSFCTYLDFNYYNNNIFLGLTTSNPYGIINIETRKGSVNMLVIKIVVLIETIILFMLIKSLIKDWHNFKKERGY